MSTDTRTGLGRVRLPSGLGPLSELGLPEPLPEHEIPDRLLICARVFDAWPNARPLNRDRTLIEYVNATRGVPIARLERCIQLAIDAGGDFMPPAGELLKRAAIQGAGGAPVGTDRDELFWHQKRVSETVREYTVRAYQIAPLNPDAEITQNQRLIGG